MLVFCLLIMGITVFSQDKGVVAGPMLGQVEIRTASVWAEVTPGSIARIWYWKKGQPSTIRQIQVETNKQDWYAPVKFNLVGLDMNTTYEYAITTTPVKPVKATASFTTKDLWQWRKPAPDFSFLAGSCLYFNDPEYDRPGKPYGQDSSILLSMAKEKAAFMVWLGDNWYTREADYYSKWGLWYRANHYRSQPVLQPFLKSTSHFAIWDDHDYGPDNSNKSYPLKDESKKVFENYWMNPSYGEDGKGIYTVVSYGDVDVFLMDDRSFRTADEIDSAYNGKRNEHKRMWGDKQLEWLSNALAASSAKFKIIASGSQFINKLSRFDCLTLYPVDFDAFMNILDKQKVEGVLLLSGDRHHSEIISYPRENGYTLYDITASSITAGVSKAGGVEKDHPMRVKNTLLEENNYARFSVSGGKNDRRIKVEFLNRAGEVKVSWSVHENELKYSK
jgi:alkaline phosphatase D